MCVWINRYSEHPVIRSGHMGAIGSQLKVINCNLLSGHKKQQGRGGWFDPSFNAISMFQNGKSSMTHSDLTSFNIQKRSGQISDRDELPAGREWLCSFTSLDWMMAAVCVNPSEILVLVVKKDLLLLLGKGICFFSFLVVKDKTRMLFTPNCFCAVIEDDDVFHLFSLMC